MSDSQFSQVGILDESENRINPATEETLDDVKDAILGLTGGIIWDEINVTYPNTTTEVYTFLEDSSTVQVITIVYTDATKEFISTVTKI